MKFTNFSFDLQAAKGFSETSFRKMNTLSNEKLERYFATKLASDWLRAGAPSCRVFPRMARILSGIRFEGIPVSEVAMPFDVLEIRLPFPEWPGSLFISEPRSRTTQRMFDLHLQDQTSTKIRSHGLVFDSGHLLIQHEIDEEARSMTEYKDDPDPGLRSEWPEELLRQCWSLAIAVVLFIQDKHSLVCPDLEPREIKHRPPARRTSDTERHYRTSSLTIGREIELPRPEYEQLDAHTDGTGRGLNYSHIRCAHYRQQACGPQHSERKRIYVGPTVVRPDLPAPPQGPRFKITDR
jgi:hypothetical protein